MLKESLYNLRKVKPLVLSITNEVTISDCASAIVAIGASAIMTSEVLEIKDLVKISSSVNINIGTVNKKSFKLMKEAAKCAKKYKKPLVLDLVGYGASKYRTEVVEKLVKNNSFSVLKGNSSEIKFLICGKQKNFLKNSSGVDARNEDKIEKISDLEKSDVQGFLFSVKNKAKKLKSTIVVTGAIDLIISEDNIYVAENGHSMMSKVCGTGCILSGVIAAFLGTSTLEDKKDTENLSLAAVCSYGICGELAFSAIKKTDGPFTYKNKLIDSLYVLKEEDLEKKAKYQII